MDTVDVLCQVKLKYVQARNSFRRYQEMDTATKALPLVGLMWGLSNNYGKDYCFPSQNKILELLKERFKIAISIATINRWLKVVEMNGYIKRTRRIRHDKKLGMVFQSTLYHITHKGNRLLANYGVVAWNGIKKVARTVREKLTRPRRKKGKKTPGVSDYFLAGSGLLKGVSKKPT